MVETFSFEEGSVLGGPVLFQEPEWNLKRRKKFPKIAILITILLLFLLLGVPLLLMSISSNGFSMFSVYMYLITGIMVFVMVWLLGIKSPDKMWPLTVYANGVSIPYGAKPYYRFSDVYYIEQCTTGDEKGTGLFFTIITFSDGTYCPVPKHMSPKDELYHEFHKIITARLIEVKNGFLWTDDAEELISSLTGIKGLTRLDIENSARRRGENRVGLDFIQKHWRDIIKEQVHRSIEFENIAKMRWGKSS